MSADADVFCELLRVRLSIAQHQYPDLDARGAAYRCDPLFELAADFADALALYERGDVGPTVVREYALKVAALAAVVYIATVGRARRAEKETADDGHD